MAYTPRIWESDSQSRVFTEYNYNENIHVDNNKIRTLEIMREKKEEGITVNNEDGKDEFSVSF